MPPEAKEPALPILIVDDEEIVLVALRDTLVREGYQVVASPHAVHAQSILKEQKFSVVITDQQMPMVTGLDFLAQVKEIQPDASRILITAVLNLGTMIDAINKGEIFRFMVKPWLREELLATVKNAVQRFELLSSNSRLQAETAAANEKLKQLNRELEAQVSRVANQNEQLAAVAKAQDENLRQSVSLCVQLMEAYYPLLGTRARRVVALCEAMARGLGLPPQDRQVLEISAWIHDVGLVGVPRRLIKLWEQDPAALSQDEYALLSQHPVLGAELAHFAHHLEGVAPTIRAHHERFDGSGYPDKLKGADIPWLARLLAVAVDFVELETPVEQATAEISRGSGKTYDPEAVRVFLKFLPKAAIPTKQRRVALSELSPGMILAQGIYSESGTLLLPDGQKLTAAYIEKLRHHNRITPISQSLLVYC